MELVGGLDHDIGRAGDQIVGLEQAVTLLKSKPQICAIGADGGHLFVASLANGQSS